MQGYQARAAEGTAAPLVLVVAATEAGLRAALPFAQRVAATREGRVHALHVVQPGPLSMAPVPVRAAPWLEALGGEQSVTFETVEAEDLYEATVLVAPDLAASLAILATGGGSVTTARARKLLASPPCPALLLVNAGDGFQPRRILLATNTSAALPREVIDLSYTLVNTGGDAHVDFLRLVPPSVPEKDLEDARAAIQERIAAREPEFAFEVVVRHARSFETGVLEALQHGGYDLVLADAPREGLVARLSPRVVPTRLVGSGTPVMLYSAPPGRVSRVFLGGWQRVYGAVPKLTEDARRAIYAQVRRNSRGDADFYVLLALSVLIASFGLLQDSTAVVIGAMIVAPLMQPILGLGLGVATANTRLMGLGARTAAAGIATAVLLAFGVGLLLPGADITDELSARGQPGLLDLLVALASGAAGAYATSRPGAAASAAGVAIAVALVPPLSTIGIGAALGDWPLAVGATLLFLTNFAAIGAASTGMFLWLGFQPEATRFGSRRAFAQGALALAVLVGVVAVSLVAWTRASDARFERQVFDAVEVAVQGVEPEAELESVDVDHGDGIVFVDAVVATSNPALLVAETTIVQSQVTRELDEPVTLRIEAIEPEAE